MVMMPVVIVSVIYGRAMLGALDVAAARHDEDVAVGAHHLDVGAVKAETAPAR